MNILFPLERIPCLSVKDESKYVLTIDKKKCRLRLAKDDHTIERMDERASKYNGYDNFTRITGKNHNHIFTCSTSK